MNFYKKMYSENNNYNKNKQKKNKIESRKPLLFDIRLGENLINEKNKKILKRITYLENKISSIKRELDRNNNSLKKINNILNNNR